MNACLQASAFGASSSLSAGGDARCRISRSGTVCVAGMVDGCVRTDVEMM
jgi:hypothetical protein